MSRGKQKNKGHENSFSAAKQQQNTHRTPDNQIQAPHAQIATAPVTQPGPPHASNTPHNGIKQVAPNTGSASAKEAKQDVTQPTQSFFTKFWRGMAKVWGQFLTLVSSTVLTSVIAILFGFNPFPDSFPVAIFIHQHPVASVVIGAALLIMSILAIPIWPFLEPDQESRINNIRKASKILFNTFPITGYGLFTGLLILIIARPVWCPDAICPAPRLVPIVYQQGVNDGNVEAYFTAIQTSAYALPKDPATYTLNTLPSSSQPGSIGAQRIDDNAPAPYRVVLGIHNLQHGKFGMFIEQVALSIKHLPPTPYPLHVWEHSASLNYQTNLFRVAYNGQGKGALLPATYVSFPNLHVQLAPGETDTIDLEVDSRVPADIQFQVQITYRVSNEPLTHVILLPNLFEVVFSNASNWQLYGI